MGARVYLASIGRFLQVDSIEGGTDNAYAYVNDPVNDFDLDGTFSLKKAFGKVAAAASIASIIPGPIGMAAAGVAAAAYAAAGDKKQAALMAAGIALAAVGAGGAVVAYKAVKSAKAITTVARLGQIQKLSQSYGKQGVITGYTKHALGRTAGTRGGPQISPQAVKYIVANGKQTYNVTRKTYDYDHSLLGRVSLNTRGKVTTVIAKSRYGRYIR